VEESEDAIEAATSGRAGTRFGSAPAPGGRKLSFVNDGNNTLNVLS
jgi:hypothetical protein